MSDDLDHTWRSRRHDTDHSRIRRITAGLEEEADALAGGTLVPRRRRLAPAEHWRPAPAEGEQAEEAWPDDDEPVEPADEWAGEPAPEVRVEIPPPAPVDLPAPEAGGAGLRPGAPALRLEPAAWPAVPALAGLPEPAPEAKVDEPAPPARRPWWRLAPGSKARTATWLDRLLVVIEVLAMLGLVGATFVSLGLVDRLTNDLGRLGGAATRPPATGAPTPTPLPSPSATAPPGSAAQPFGAILPGGRDATPAPTQAAPAASLVGARITIEAIGVDAPIVEGDDWETLKQGVGHHPGSPLPGQPGNVVLAAHNDVYGSIFRKLSELREGDAVRIDTQAGSYHYRVTSVRIVLPTETSVLDPAAGPALTLITCYPPLVDTHRVVVTAESIE